jgi:membrane-bound lytic murein transglycosylase B
MSCRAPGAILDPVTGSHGGTGRTLRPAVPEGTGPDGDRPGGRAAGPVTPRPAPDATPGADTPGIVEAVTGRAGTGPADAPSGPGDADEPSTPGGTGTAAAAAKPEPEAAAAEPVADAAAEPEAGAAAEPEPEAAAEPEPEARPDAGGAIEPDPGTVAGPDAGAAGTAAGPDAGAAGTVVGPDAGAAGTAVGPGANPEPAAKGTPAPAPAPTSARTPTPAARTGRAGGLRAVTAGQAARLRSGAVLVRRTVARGGRATRDWSRRPAGRFAVPLLSAVAAVIAAATMGVLAVPAVAPRPAAAQQLPAPTGPVGVPQATVAAGGAYLPPSVAPPVESGGPAAPQRPADALAAWATRLSGPLSIPVPALEAYGYAQLATQQTTPNCHLRWTTLAGIGKVESTHGSANGSRLLADGRVQPPILGPVLDGSHGTSIVRDTDQGRFDGDRTYDRALGPMQFLPATWQRYGSDADADGTADPNDIDDAALATARYLCAAGRDLDETGDWWTAILTYNGVSEYAMNVFDAADSYGRISRSVT